MIGRICDKCGKDRPHEGAKTCEKGHFICKHCVNETIGIFTGSARKQCPLCQKPLR